MSGLLTFHVNGTLSRLIIWLAQRAGKMKRILCSDCQPEGTKWAYLARSGLPALVPQKRNSVGVMFWPYNKSFIDQACLVKIGLVLFCVFMDLDFVSVHTCDQTRESPAHIRLLPFNQDIFFIAQGTLITSPSNLVIIDKAN